MIWKGLLRSYIFEIILVAVMIVAVFISPYGSQGYINRAVEVFALAFGFEGSSELKRHGRWKIRRNFFVFIIMLFTSSLILLLTHSVREVYLQIVFYSCFAVLAAIFPIAYYLSRNQRKSTPHPTITDAN